jgi:hypothetical protein
MNPNTCYGVGVGYNQAPLNQPIAVATVSTFATFGELLSSPAYSVATFNNLTNFAVDGSMVYGAFQMNLGYQSQKLKNDTAQSYGTASPAGQVFNNDGKSTSLWVEGGYLLMGDSYSFNDAKAVVGGVKLRENQAGLELVLRYGKENRKNVLALVNAVGYSDFSTTSANPAVKTTSNLIQADVISVDLLDQYILLTVDNTATPGSTGTTLVVSDETAFEEKASGYAIGLNYYLTENAVIKTEFEQRSNKFNRVHASSTDQDSLYSKSVSTLRVRADYSF